MTEVYSNVWSGTELRQWWLSERICSHLGCGRCAAFHMEEFSSALTAACAMQKQLTGWRSLAVRMSGN